MVFSDMLHAKPANQEERISHMELEIVNLSKQFKKKFAVKDINVTLVPGIWGLLGANGAGKTTMMRMIAGILEPSQGRTLYDGKDIRNNYEYRNVFGFLPQEIQFSKDLTVNDYLEYVAALKDVSPDITKKRINRLLSVLTLEDVKNKKIVKLSGGMKRRVGIAQAILGKPKLLILDEPMSGLDPMGRRDVREAILELNRDGVTIFYSSHLLSDVESISHRVAMIVDGRIVREGTVDEITDSCGIEYHVRTRTAIAAKDLPEGVALAGHPQEVICADDAARDRLLRYCLDNGIAVEKMDHKRPSLEDILTEEIARADA